MRDGVPHHGLPWIGQFFGIIPAMVETPEEAMAYLEPMAAYWLRSPERMADEGVTDIFQNICGLRDGYAACPRWSAAAVEPRFAAMLLRLQPLAETGDPLLHAQLDFIRTFREKEYQGRPPEGYPPQGPDAVMAARNLLTAYQARAAGNPKWGQAVQVWEGMRVWQALSCLPWPEQETWFDKLFLPALRQGYTRNFSYSCGVYFALPPAPAPSPEYRRMIVQAYAVLAHQSGNDLDNVLQNMRSKAKAFGVPLTDGLPGNGDALVREIDLSAAGLPKDRPCHIAGFVQEPETLWLLIKGGWNGVLRYDVKGARVTGAARWPWADGRCPDNLHSGGQMITVSADAVWWSEYNQICRLPKSAFTLPATLVVPAAAAISGLTPPPNDIFAVVDDWIYWHAQYGGIWRLRQAAGKPAGAAECVADATRVGGSGPLDGKGGWGAVTLVADPPRHRVLCLVVESPSNGSCGGIWSHRVATGRLEQVVQAEFGNSDARTCTLDDGRWAYDGGSFGRVMVDLRQDRVEYGLALDPPFSWKHPGDPQNSVAPNLPLPVVDAEYRTAWTKPCFTLTPAAPGAMLLFKPDGEGARVRVFTPTACLAEVKNDARLLDQLITGAWWTPRGILVAAVWDRKGPMKLWLYEVAMKAVPPVLGK